MSLPLLIATCAALLFGILTISSSLRERKLKKRIYHLETDLANRELEERLLAEVYQNIDHQPDIKSIVAIITSYVRSLLPCTTISSIIITEEKMDLHTIAIEPVSHSYIESTKEMIFKAIAAHDRHLTEGFILSEHTTGDVSIDASRASIADSFHLPIMVHNSIAAVITITAAEKGRFQHNILASLQRITRHIGTTISKLDAALEVEKGRMTAMIESLNDGIIMVDTERNLQFINPTARQLLHLHSPHPSTLDVLSCLPINHDFLGKIRNALAENHTGHLGGIAIKNKLVSFTITPVRSSTGIVLGAAIIMRDDTLQHSVPRMKEDFTNIIIHHLRSPLTSIKASSQLLNTRIDLTPTEQQKLIHLIFQQSTKLLNEVQEILDAAKLEAGVFTLHKKSNDLKAVITQVCESFHQEAQQKMIRLDFDIDHRLPHFKFDSEQITHALTDILSNSLKFTGAGGHIRITAKQKLDKAVLVLSDSGIGIPKDKQHLLFHKFSQIADANAQIGTGLGLYVVKGVIEAHGGSIRLDSDTGKGTSIIITLPLLDPTNHTEAESQQNQQRLVN